MSKQNSSIVSKRNLHTKSNFIGLDNTFFRYSKIAFISASVMFFACKSEKTNIPKENDLHGMWSVVYSEMNNKPNDLMHEAYFNFMDGNKVESNLFEGESFDYAVKDGGLYIDNPEQFLLGVDYFQNDTLVLSGKLKYYQMLFKMVKVKGI